MISLTQIIADEEMGGTPFLVHRSWYRKSEGEKTLIREERLEVTGTIHPAKLEEIQLMPEEYRHENVIVIHSPVSLSLGGAVDETEFAAPDQVLYQRRKWRVISVRDWSVFGFCKAMAVGITEN